MAVGFECKISDKLTRRAFPRGYTESLEDRIRQLESENSRLSNLIDIKDEQMELLSRVQSTLGGPQHTYNRTSYSSEADRPQSSAPCRKLSDVSSTSSEGEDELVLTMKENKELDANGMFWGASSGNVFLDALSDKLRVKGYDESFINNLVTVYHNVRCGSDDLSCSGSGLLIPPTPESLDTRSNASPCGAGGDVLSNFPARSLSDKLVTIYFEEWHSMYLILDQDSFLVNYTMFLDEQPLSCDLNGFVSSLALVLLMANLSCKDRIGLSSEDIRRLETEYRNRIGRVGQHWNLGSLSVLCQALMYALHCGSVNEIWNYRTLAVSMALRLGLHKNLREDQFSVTRTQLFWVTYTLDVFASAVLGTTRLMHDNDIDCSVPANICDQVSENNESEPSCQLCVVQFSRILARIIDQVYGSNQRQLTAKSLISLDDELESWLKDLPPKLKFEFTNGAPSARLSPIHQKAPLLLMLSHYARLLIHLPSITAFGRDSNSTRASPSNVAVMQSAKTYLQILEYLKKRKVNPTLLLNSGQMIALLGTMVVYSAVDYSKGGALLQQVRKLLGSCLRLLREDLVAGLYGSLHQKTFGTLESCFDYLLSGASNNDQSMKKSHQRVEAGAIPSCPTLSPSGTTTSSLLLSPEQDVGSFLAPSMENGQAHQPSCISTNDGDQYSMMVATNAHPGDQGLNAGKLLEDIMSLNRPYQSPHSHHSINRAQSLAMPRTQFDHNSSMPVDHRHSDLVFDHAILEDLHATNTILDNFNWDDSFSWNVRH